MKKKMRIFALGGNEIAPVASIDPKTGATRNPDISEQWQRTAVTCAALADIVAEDPSVYYVITHGNGPQIGNILLRSEYSLPILHAIPLDVCGADSQGALAYMLGQINNDFALRGLPKLAAGVVTCCEVDPDDEAFRDPTKFIGPSYTYEEAMEKRRSQNWLVKIYKKGSNGQDLWRRVVPSPVPTRVRELEAIVTLVKGGIIPITVGGGGIPVARAKPVKEGHMFRYDCHYGVEHVTERENLPLVKGVEAVIDKDLASAVLALALKEALAKDHIEVDSELFILTDVDGVRINYQKPDEQVITHMTVAQANRWYNEGQFAAGSMGPKVKACINFVERGGDRAYITNVGVFAQTLLGKKGTVITR